MPTSSHDRLSTIFTICADCLIDCTGNDILDILQAFVVLLENFLMLLHHLCLEVDSNFIDCILNLVLQLRIAIHDFLLQSLMALLILPLDPVKLLPRLLRLILLTLDQLLVQEVVEIVELLLDHLLK